MATETTKIPFVEGAAAATPAAGRVVTYAKADGLMYSKDDAGVETLMSAGSGSGISATIFDAAGDIIYASAADTAARLAAGAAGTILTSAGVAAPVWAAPPQSAAYTRTAGNYTTNTASMTDIDGTNIAFTFTTRARRVVVGQMGSVAINNAGGEVAFDVLVDGTPQGSSFGIVYMQAAVVGEYMNCSFTYLTDVLTAASHTFKIQWRVSSGHTATLLGSAGSGMYSRFFAYELG
jgi:hypothetical protein